MANKKVVVALGGNALGNNPQEQLELVKSTAAAIVDLALGGVDVVVGHGNGPQVGMINNAMLFSANNGGNTPEMPFAECGAMSQGYIGYHLQQAIQNELKRRNSDKKCATVVTQVVVSKDDPGFKNPTKPVGTFFSEQEAKQRALLTGDTYVEDAGRGWRKVVASPIPVRIQELDLIKTLSDTGAIVIAIGGGGIPVVEEDDGSLKGVSAVIDKDNASARLAIDLNAENLVILTAVEKVSINFKTPEQKDLDSMSIQEAKQYIDEKQFAPGSMLPKVQACIKYVEETGHSALITSLQKAADGLKGLTGTFVTK
ncbi:MAG: carbamate kinase [Erysipelotrichaceae bacterium]|nr:carbamate kinase [Erysipelotrichaceae bacterium]